MVRSTVDAVLFDEGSNEAIREALPETVITAFGYLTHLGDGATLIVFATLLYWFGADSRRERRALVIAIGLGALAISAGLKGIFVAPRPELADGYGGYSFPSAHAMGAAAFYGALAVISETGTRRQRYLVAGTIIVLIAFSRVVIGVHFIGDVVVGVILGLALVAFAVRDDQPEPGFIFALAGVIAILAYILGSRQFVTMTIGASLGATVVWYYIKPQRARPLGASILFLGYLLVPLVVGLRIVTSGVLDIDLGTLHWAIETVGFALVTGAIIAVPVVAERLNDWPPVEWLQARLPFAGRTVDHEQLPTLETSD